MNAIREYRNGIGASQHDLAKMLGVTKATISRWESGGRFPSAHKAAEIEKLTNGAVSRVELRPDIFGEPFEG